MEARHDLLKAEIYKKEQVLKSGANKTRHIGLTLTFLFVTALISVFYLQQGPEAQSQFESHKDTLHNGRVPQCPSGFPLPASPPAPVNLWASIDLEEAAQIRQWLEAPERGLNLSAVNPAYPSSDNMIYNLEAYYPTKTEALAYLESPLSVSIPEKYARVTIHHGAQLEPIVKDYLVGPLPVGPKTEMRELKNPSYPDGIPYNARGLFLNEELAQFLGRITRPLADAMKVSVVIFHFRSKLNGTRICLAAWLRDFPTIPLAQTFLARSASMESSDVYG
jgi:primary-amine oxidase